MSVTAGLLWTFATILTLTVSQELDLQILPSGDIHTKPLGGDTLFTCSAPGLAPSEESNLQWFDKEGIEITQTSGSRIYLEEAGPHALKLYITQIENADAGLYTCRGELNGATDEVPVRLDIFKDITFDHAPSPQYKAVFTDALIECQVSGQPVPTVSWRYNGETIFTGNRYIVEADGLKIMNITQDDDNFDYLCRAEVLEDGRYAQRQISVEVHIPPSITTPMGTQQGIAGQEVSLSCHAAGDPPPKYEFYKEDSTSPIQPSSRVEVDRDAGDIHFRPLIEQDKGNYRCKAINDVGQVEDPGELVVLVPPMVREIVNQTAVEGQSQTLECHAEGDPYPSMTFHKVGNEMPYDLGENENGKIILTYTTNNNPDDKLATLKMEVKNLSPTDTANYTCIANNDAGDQKLNGTITVQYAPRFKEGEVTEFYLWAGKTRNVTCRTEAEPEPAIKWMKEGVQLINNETYKIYNMGRDSNLQITCLEQDQGWIYDTYVCTANNNISPMMEMELEVNRASLPTAPVEVNVRESSPTTVLLDVVPPNDDGGIPIMGYRITYENKLSEVAIDALGNGSEPALIENLNPNTIYIFQVRAKNEVGSGPPYDLEHETEDIRKPSPLELEAAPEPPEYAFEFELKWKAVETGGLPIDQYEFMIREVLLKDDGTLDKPMNDWVRSLRNDNKDNPMQSYMFGNLSPSKHYQVKTRAHNDIGWSDEHPQYFFKTLEDPGYGPVHGGAPPLSHVSCFQVAALVSVCCVALLWGRLEN